MIVLLDLIYFGIFVFGLLKIAELLIAGWIRITVALDHREARRHPRSSR